MDDLVDHVVLYVPKPVWTHGYALPFVIFYGFFLYIWIGIYGFLDYFEIGCIVMSVVGLLQVLTVLFCIWFVGIRCLLNCKRENDSTKAKLAKVVPMPNNGSTELVNLRRTTNRDGKLLIWFEFQKVKYLFDSEEKRQFRTVQFPLNEPLSYYQNSKGLEDDEAVRLAIEKYGDNKMEMFIPTFLELFQERATAPFFVFQLFCVGLWCLDDYWYYSVFTLFMLITFEATMVKQQLKYMVEIRNMGNKPYMINVYRTKRWSKISTDQLIAGDLISIGRSQNENLVPCDVLLVRGSCIVDESMLTGESIPQMKEPIEELESNRILDLDSDSKLHILSGGTKVVQHSAPMKVGAGLKAPDNGCVGYVLRTGFKTSQGQLLRTILFGVKRVTANNLETFGFILFLLIFAVMAAAYVWNKGSQDETRNKYKLFLECTLILTSVVPPELPIELSLAVNNSLLALQKLGVYCTEPFRIPFAGKVDICCFDKTGTLTTDNLILEGVTGINGDPRIVPTAEVPLDTVQVLVSCHSLAQLEEEMVGDPLEKACLSSLDWMLTKNDSVIHKKGKFTPLKIFARFHFSSSLKRMSVITGYLPVGSPDVVYLATAKGAPETLKPMFVDAPDSYDAIYQQMTREGSRVLALGYKELGQLSHKEVREMTRNDVEKDLKFAGFVVISCPLKPDSKSVIKEIVGSSHQVAIITGDNSLTACHVAKELKFTRKKQTLILDSHSTYDEFNVEFRWTSVDQSITLDVVPEIGWSSLVKEYDLCLTGQAFSFLSTNHDNFLRKILPHVKVYARMAPKQKEHVVTRLKALGYTTLMCGDGTNDVGALKHANVGVALLSHPLVSEKLKEKEKELGISEADGASKAPNSSTVAPKAGLQKRNPKFGRPIRDDPATNNRASPPPSAAKKKLDQMLKDLEEEEKAQIVRLGDASIAAPFTSKYSSIQSICHVIKQGRCTLVTTLQMFKILALNALVLAYSQSVLYLDGIKFSDSQATVQGLLLAACFLFISRSKPLKTLAKQRPLANIFNIYTLLTVTLQFAVHFCCLLYLVQEAHVRAAAEGVQEKEETFKPNLLNTTVYIMSVALQVSTFAVNYRGRPFMESLLENKALAYSILFSGSSILALTVGLMPDMSAKFELVELPADFRNTVLMILACDFSGCFVVDRVCQFLFGDMRVR